MTIREYIESNVADIVDELCQYQACDNCSIGSMFERCPLLDMPTEEAIDWNEDQKVDREADDEKQ